jgi:hypothetical protein
MKLHKNFDSMRQTVETMLLGCSCQCNCSYCYEYCTLGNPAVSGTRYLSNNSTAQLVAMGSVIEG